MYNPDELFEKFATDNQIGLPNSPNWVLAKRAYLEGFGHALSFSRNAVADLRNVHDHPDDVVISAMDSLDSLAKDINN